MAEQLAASTARVKERDKVDDDFQLRKEAGKLGIWGFALLALVVGGLSLAALISALYHMFH